MNRIKQPITEFIPQRHPFVMIDTLCEANEDFVKTSLHITENNIFTRNGLFIESGLIEAMSQTGAAGIGYYCNTNGLAVPIGYIGAIKNLRIHFLPLVNTLIDIELRIVTKLTNVSIAQANVKSNGELVAECELKIFIIQNI